MRAALPRATCGALAAAAAVTVLSGCRILPIDCDDYVFDRAAWRAAGDDERPDIARDVVHCRVLLGRSQAEVKRMLGPPEQDHHRFTLRFPAGVVNDAMGPGDAEELIVDVDRHGRVTGARTLYGGDRAGD